MRIALAQIRPIKGDASSNIEAHKRLIELAISFQSNAVFFPELSLTSYEPELAKRLIINQEDARLQVFQNISNKDRITIGLGLPTKSERGIHISISIFQPNQTNQIYSKQQLHSDELPYFTEGKEQLIIEIENHKIAPAICYESLQVEHTENACQLGAKIYLASVAKSQKGLEKAIVHYSKIAQKYGMTIMMVNCIGFCDNFESVGGTGIWSKEGELLGQLDDKREGVLCFDTETDEVNSIYLEAVSS